MAKKLLTNNKTLVEEVEHVLNETNVPYVIYSPEENYRIVAVLNRDGETLREIVNTIGTGTEFFFGVLRNHPSYTVPKELLTVLNNWNRCGDSYKVRRKMSA